MKDEISINDEAPRPKRPRRGAAHTGLSAIRKNASLRDKGLLSSIESGIDLEVGGITNLVRIDGHLLLKSLAIEDWSETLREDRESRLASLIDCSSTTTRLEEA